ncbi:hypothetical protein HK102_000153 [Quaeritorhiza haematococci]|nr:hypothetical protein HK102_000153 [Quaeritorhiza haematococci]
MVRPTKPGIAAPNAVMNCYPQPWQPQNGGYVHPQSFPTAAHPQMFSNTTYTQGRTPHMYISEYERIQPWIPKQAVMDATGRWRIVPRCPATPVTMKHPQTKEVLTLFVGVASIWFHDAPPRAPKSSSSAVVNKRRPHCRRDRSQREVGERPKPNERNGVAPIPPSSGHKPLEIAVMESAVKIEETGHGVSTPGQADEKGNSDAFPVGIEPDFRGCANCTEAISAVDLRRGAIDIPPAAEGSEIAGVTADDKVERSVKPVVVMPHPPFPAIRFHIDVGKVGFRVTPIAV